MANPFQKLVQAFGISFVKNGSTNQVVPGKKDLKDEKLKPIEFTDDLKKIWNWWEKQTTDSSNTLKNRMERYADLDYMYYNDTVVSSAIELYADETVQFDSQNQPLIVNAKDKKVVNYINDFFEKIGVNQQSLRETARNLAQYGDSFSVNSLIEGKGYRESLVVDVTTVKDRLEFNAVRAKKEMTSFLGISSLFSRDQRLNQLAGILKNSKENKDSVDYYRSYLFGFQLEDDLYLPPWAVSHFRLLSSKSEFYPFGRPLMINSVSPFRQLKASKNLMAMARAAKFPKEHFAIETSDTMTAAEKWAAVNEARQEYQNLTYDQAAKEDYAVGGAVWTPKGLLDYNMIEPKMNLDDIADIELLRDDIILGTRIPKGYLIVDRGSWGTSGQALLQQYKPFGRSVLQIQQAILRELIQMVKIQFLMTGDYDENTEFELSMNYPVIEDSKDRLEMKNSTLALAKSVLDSLSSALGINGRLPVEVVKDIFHKYSFLGMEDLDKWIDDIAEVNKKLSEADEKKYNRLSENIVREAYFKSMKELALNEGVKSNRHFMTSWGSKDPVNEGVLQTLKLKPETRQRV